jgi:hypothetical protein
MTDGSYQLLPYPLPDSLPAGLGGLVIHSRPREGYDPAIIGIDGEPAMREFGDAVVALPPGPHIIEVQYGQPVRSVLTTIHADQLTEFSYSPADALGRPSGLGNRRRLVTGVNPGPIVGSLVVAFLLFCVGTLALGQDHPILTLLVGLVALAAGVGVYVRLTRRRRQ